MFFETNILINNFKYIFFNLLIFKAKISLFGTCFFVKPVSISVFYYKFTTKYNGNARFCPVKIWWIMNPHVGTPSILEY
jgi:hypothetical protein